jgi:molybdate transport system ATP-binding protein
MIEFSFIARAGAFELAAAGRTRTPGIIGVFGPSGAGKTTFLRAVAGLAPLTSGTIKINGSALTGRPEQRRIAYVFQDNRLFPHLSVQENLLFGLKRAPLPHRLRLDDAVAALDLSPLLARSTRFLSGGEQKRVALGRALLSQPRLVLMDEPLAGIDAARKTETIDLIRNVRARFDATILFVTHEIDDIAALADDLILIDQGEVTACGDARQIFADPAGPLGEREDARTLVDAVVERVDAALGITVLAVGVAKLTMPWSPHAPGARVRTQIFARDVTLAAKLPEAVSTQNVLPAKVFSLRQRADRLALVALDTPAGAILSTITQQSAARLALAPGVDVFALVKATSFSPRDHS